MKDYFMSLMLAETFFSAISEGIHVGLLKFQCGDELEVTQSNLQVSSQLAGGKVIKEHYRIKLPNGGSLVLDNDWLPVPSIGDNSHRVISAEFIDMAWIVSQVALGNKWGSFFTAQGHKLLGTKDTVKLCPDFEKQGWFLLFNGEKKTSDRYTVLTRVDPDICKHGQLPSLNITDFIENYK